jgi:hypothetical protein
MRAFACAAVACLALGSAGEVAAGEGAYRFEELLFEIPEQYRERISGPPSLPGSRIPDVAFVAVGDSSPNYVIQIRGGIVQGLTPTSGSPEDQERDLEFVATMLDEHLEELEEIRPEFERTPARRVFLGGHPALRVTWVGKREGRPMKGVFYGLMIGAKVLEISVQGPGGSPDEMFKLALDTVERLEIVKTN